MWACSGVDFATIIEKEKSHEAVLILIFLTDSKADMRSDATGSSVLTLTSSLRLGE